MGLLDPINLNPRNDGRVVYFGTCPVFVHRPYV